eukprot:4487539-Pleurochrysis_carterae.AAC.1
MIRVRAKKSRCVMMSAAISSTETVADVQLTAAARSPANCAASLVRRHGVARHARVASGDTVTMRNGLDGCRKISIP